MSPLQGRDGHVFVASYDEGSARCIRCRRLKSDHAISRFSAHYMTVASSTRAEQERLAQELAPSGMLFRVPHK